MFTSEQKSIWPSRLLTSLLLGIALFFPLSLFGAETEQAAPQTLPAAEFVGPPIPQTTPQAPPHDRLDSLDASRNYLSEKIISFASNMDRFFGNNRNFQESNNSVLQMDLTRVAGFGGERKYNLAARANLNLPETEGRFHLLLETTPENNVTDNNVISPTESPLLRNQVVSPGSYGLATRYETIVANAWHLSTDWGLKFPVPVTPYVRTRASYSTPMGGWRIKAAESVYWFNSTGVGETTQLDEERFLSDPVLFRATSIVTWLNDTQNFNMRQDLSIFHTMNDRTALMYQASAIGVSNPQFQLTDYEVQLLYRYRMHRDWMFFELNPQLHFPKIYNYRYSPALSMRLEVLFDGSR
jgi:hypothetical protein